MFLGMLVGGNSRWMGVSTSCGQLVSMGGGDWSWRRVGSREETST